MQAERTTPLFGRDREVGEIDRAVERARHRCGRAVFVVGERGIGVSRLVREAAERAAAGGTRVLRGRGSRSGPQVAFRPLCEALLGLVRTGGPCGEGEPGPYRRALGRLVPELGRGEPAAGDGPVPLVVLAEAVLRLASAAGREHGCLLVLEDLQDGDPETLAVVEYLADNLAHQPAVLLATASSDCPRALGLAHAVARRGSALLLRPDRLSRDAVRELAAVRLGSTADAVPDRTVDLLWNDSAGTPAVVHELLDAMVGGAAPGGGLPAVLVAGVVERAESLGPRGRDLLCAAAVCGQRFGLAVVQAVTGLDDRDLLAHVRAAVAADLVAAGPDPDWYRFTHPLVPRALRGHLAPAGRAALARRAAGAVARLHPGLPGQWCALSARLHAEGGDTATAAALYAEAGAREVAGGAPATAVALLDRAQQLAAGPYRTGQRAAIVEALLDALAQTGRSGRSGRAAALARALDELHGDGLDPRRVAALYAGLAHLALTGGRAGAAADHLRRARTLLSLAAPGRPAPAVDVVAAELGCHPPGDDAAALAGRALEAAVAAEAGPVACRALHLLGRLARRDGLAGSTARFERLDVLATGYRLPVWRLWAQFELGVDGWLARDDLAGVERARREAARRGLAVLGEAAGAIVGLALVLRGEFAAAGPLAGRYPPVGAVLAGHRGVRREMEAAAARCPAGQRLGLARSLCALLEEDRELARRELADAAEAAKTTAGGAGAALVQPLDACRGLGVLLDALPGSGVRRPAAAVAVEAAAGTRWDRHFTLLARAVRLGRAGDRRQAEAAAAQAGRAGAPYPTARHLGLRLVAPEALAGGWGDPVGWLRGAERYFHDGEVAAVARACRELLRRAGAQVPNRRRALHVPLALRTLGVTAREYEVLQLLVDRPGNQAIADRLHISPRTVEKHVAQLISKTAQPDRVALSLYAARVAAGRP